MDRSAGCARHQGVQHAVILGRLVIVPSAQFLDASAANALAAAASRGTKILVTGVITGDWYGNVPDALSSVFYDGRPVRFREASPWGRSCCCCAKR